MPTRFARPLVQITLLPLFLLGMAIAQQQPNSPKATPTPKTPPPKLSSHVVLILVSGLGADLLKAERTHLPKLNEALSQGVAASAVEGVYPSLAQPAQATIASGMLPADHGIFTNDDTVKLIELPVEPVEKAKKNVFLWESATKAGLSVAALGYKLTKDSDIKFNYTNFPELSANETTENKKQKNGVYTQALNADEQRARKACELIEAAQPNLLLINFSSLALTLSQFGTSGKEVQATLGNLDKWLAQIMASTEKTKMNAQTTFIVVSDSGMARAENEFNPNVVLAKKGWLTTDAQGNIAKWKAVAQPLGGAAAIFVKNQADEKAVEMLFREIHQTPDSAVWRIFNRQELSRVGAIPSAALMLDAAPNYLFGGAAKGSTVSKSKMQATAGYSPQRVEMRPVFSAFGKGIRSKGSLGFMRLTDVAPTVARLLGITHPASRGRVLTEVLQP